MRIILLFFFFVLAVHPVFARTYSVYYTEASGAWEDASTWKKGSYTGAIPDLNSSSFPANGGVAAGDIPGSISSTSTENQLPDIVLVRSGHHVVLASEHYYNGILIVEPGGVIEFTKDGGIKGRLVMSATASLELRGNADIVATSTNDSGVAANQLTIGDVQINGNLINLIPSPVFASLPGVLNISERLLSCLEDLFGQGTIQKTPLTEAQMRDLAACATVVVQPVEMLTYEAYAAGAEAVLQWTVAKEWDFSHYLIEWSADGHSFYQAGVVAGRGTQAGIQYYSFNHKHGQTGTLYYRLSGVDIDGTVEIKGVRVVQAGGAVFATYANQGRLYVTYNGPADSQLALLDTSGRLVLNTRLSSQGVDLAGIKSGVYLLQLSNGLERKVQRVVVR